MKFLWVVLLITIHIFTLKNTYLLAQVQVGAEQMHLYLPLLKGRRVAMLVNHTSMVGKRHLVDTLRSLKIDIQKIFVPEHGFRGKADAGEVIKDTIDFQTSIPLISLYDKHKKPTAKHLENVDVVLYDIQDVGVRFYTYISSMHYLMEACAEHNKKLIILDRPNPNASYIDGCVLDMKFQSFVGMHPIPIVYGLTYGELALMIKGEKWLSTSHTIDLIVIPVRNYTHRTRYELPVKPSPNLPNALAIALYPSLCLFEGTAISVGRGTQTPFQIAGAPQKQLGKFTFTPQSIAGMSKKPMYENEVCYGIDLRKKPIKYEFSLQYLIDFYKKYQPKEKFFNKYFDTLAGTDQLRKQIEAAMSEKQIRKSWEGALKNYKLIRQKYLLYPD
ncbi:MAG: DUF1343 domain-containing protein [Microscillaceae bacterium]|nr:DUF1343 domain-containing protein [Microscillaceae bacterium]MDW8459990.1 DUF1343 domain-containing protein [Cytophagales bacterium]